MPSGDGGVVEVNWRIGNFAELGHCPLSASRVAREPSYQAFFLLNCIEVVVVHSQV